MYKRKISKTSSIVKWAVFFFSFLPGGVTAQANLISPKDFLGYELGERFTPHHKVTDYFDHVAANSESVVFEKYGETYEHRPLALAFISSPENIRNLENIRKANLYRAGLVNGAQFNSSVAIVWFSYNVHGNEAVSTEAALKTLYSLANPDGKTKEWLEHIVVVIDPVLNPDGRERYVNFFTQWANSMPNPNPDSREHYEPWPNGRGNHYLFDLNRDWAWQTQIESKQRMKVYNSWLPHVHVDFHEQGIDEPYYFAPAAEPLHQVITPWQREFQETIGKNNARYFDQNNWLFFTKERFDLLYPSYGDTYPMYNGSIGMTYEQGGSGRAGLSVLTSEGDTLTLKQRIDHHYTTGIATLETCAQNTNRLLQEFESYFRRATDHPDSEFKTYVIKYENNKDKLDNLREFLNQVGIQYGSGRPQKNVQGHSFGLNRNSKFDVHENDLVISTYQPKSALVQVLFEPKPFLKDSVTYDITAWAVPFMFDLEAYAVKSKLAVNDIFQGNDLSSPNVIEKPYAYIAEWRSIKDLKWLSVLLKKGVKVRAAKKPFEIEGVKYAPGSMIITRKGNEHLGAALDSFIISTANSLGRNIRGVRSGWVDSGNDFGSGSTSIVHPPKVAVLSGKGVSSLSFGEIWHFFDQDLVYPITVLDTEYFSSLSLYNYDVLIFPGGDYHSVLDEKMLDKMSEWVKNGGRLIAVEKALSFFVDKDDFGLVRYHSEEEQKKAQEIEDKLDLSLITSPYKEKERAEISSYVLGGIYRTQFDNSHPLGFGYPMHYFTIKVASERYAYLKSGINVAVIPNAEAHFSGFVGHKAKQKQVQSLVFGVHDHGKGALIYLVDNPLFRSFWHNGKLLFGNAVFLVGQ